MLHELDFLNQLKEDILDISEFSSLGADVSTIWLKAVYKMLEESVEDSWQKDLIQKVKYSDLTKIEKDQWTDLFLDLITNGWKSLNQPFFNMAVGGRFGHWIAKSSYAKDMIDLPIEGNGNSLVSLVDRDELGADEIISFLMNYQSKGYIIEVSNKPGGVIGGDSIQIERIHKKS
jgi:hypothetical protein